LICIDRPGAPMDLVATNITKSSCELSWSEPQDNGGSEVLFYSIER